jgi:transcriptional regulator with XRE-family HTH domain
LGDHIRKRRLDLGLLQKDVAAVLRVDTTTINNWEHHRCQPRLYLFPRITQFLGYNPFPKIENPAIIEAIKTYRLNHGLSQKKMAKLLGIDPTTLARWEKGKAAPSRQLSRRLIELINR